MKKLLASLLFVPALALAEDVTLDNLVRAETDHMIRSSMKASNLEVGRLSHFRDTVDLDNQTIIRTNMDTIYSSLVLDLSEPVEITLPEIDGRYQSMQVISQDHYMFVEATPGTYRLTEDKVGTPFAVVVFRTFVDPGDPDDLKEAHVAQDGIAVSGGGGGPFEAPDWDLSQLAAARQAMNGLATAIDFDTRYAFGSKDEVRPVDYVVGAMAGWAGLPAKAALYLLGEVDQNDGTISHVVTAKDVPVDAFWSVTVYNKDGFLEPNDLGRNSYNNVTATPNDDRSITIHFGACDDGRINCIPVTPGWNYAVRLYRPQQELLDGDWTFPQMEPIEAN